ncbi:uncharacterized protein C8R40DRAFT_192845 [Lentinula edodes]|nr:uncharacterized protein C8R40DRAFT_192845 [Lentinula edodes]KAH7875728.1 hypothetical protein C8R40DRAFT_192845 [Lentinula edodes]
MAVDTKLKFVQNYIKVTMTVTVHPTEYRNGHSFLSFKKNAGSSNFTLSLATSLGAGLQIQNSYFLILSTMKTHISQFPLSLLKIRFLRTILTMLLLCSALLVTIASASPLPPFPEHSELVFSAADPNVSLTSIEGYEHAVNVEHGTYVVGSDSHQPAAVDDEYEDDLNAITTDQLQLYPRGVGKVLNKFNDGVKRVFNPLSSDWKLLGFAYTKPEQQRSPEQNNAVDLNQIALPALRLESKGALLYLLTRLGLKDQNPNDQYSTCLVYAKKSEINKEMPHMFYEESPPLPAYDELTIDLDESLPVYSPETPPGHHAPDPSTLHMHTPAEHHNSIRFFSYQNLQEVTVLEISKEYERKWKLFGLCHPSGSENLMFLPKKAELDEWKSKIRAWPKNREL